MNRTLKLLFLGSLLLNLLLAGVIIGHIWWHMAGPGYFMGENLVETLPPDQKQKVMTAMQQIHDNTRDLRIQMTLARDKSAKLLAANSFDKPAYMANMSHLQDLHDQLSQIINTRLADLAEGMTPQERSALADAMHRDFINHRGQNKTE